LDDPTGTVVMHRSEPSRLQSLALQLTDKVNNFVDSNERIFEMKQGMQLFTIDIADHYVFYVCYCIIYYYLLLSYLFNVKLF